MKTDAANVVKSGTVRTALAPRFSRHTLLVFVSSELQRDKVREFLSLHLWILINVFTGAALAIICEASDSVHK